MAREAALRDTAAPEVPDADGGAEEALSLRAAPVLWIIVDGHGQFLEDIGMGFVLSRKKAKIKQARHDVDVHVRISQEDAEVLMRKAEASGMSFSGTVRFLLKTAIRAIMADETTEQPQQ